MTPSLLTDSVSYDLERAVHYTLLWGLEAVELRTVDGPMDRVPHVNEQKVRGRLFDNELDVAAVVPGLFEGDVGDRAASLNDLSTLDETLRFCSRIDCSRIVVSGFAGDAGGDAVAAAADILRRAGERASRRNVILCVLNAEDGMATSAVLADLIGAVDLESVRAAWDPAAAAVSGEDPATALDALAPHVAFVRCRNVEQTGNGWEPRTIDKGAVDWGDQLKRLSDAGFDGPVSLDVTVEPKPKTGLSDATLLIRWIRDARR